MFDGQVSERGVTEWFDVEEPEWKTLHRKLRSIAKRRVALEAEEARYLVDAEDTQLYRRLGYTTILEYMERELYYGPHAANERLRVARALGELPLIAEVFADGELCFSAVRELTRVATPATEQAFLAKAQGKTAHQIQAMVAGLKPGDEPGATPDPRRIRERAFLDLSPESAAKLRALRDEFEHQQGERLSDSDFVDAVYRRIRESGSTTNVPPPAVQIAVTTCKVCKDSAIAMPGATLPIDAPTAARLRCDAVDIGDLDSNARTRPSAIPRAIRRKVWHRDQACAVPGCRSTRYLDIHHIRPLEAGGDHSIANLILLCAGCHKRNHEGALGISGEAPNALVFTRHHDEDVDSAMTGPRWDWVDDEQRDDGTDALDATKRQRS